MVIIEGIHVPVGPSFVQLFDLTVFVDAPADLRLIRRIRRDEAERGRSAESVIQQYLRFVRAAQARFIDPARHICDIVVACEAAPPNRDAPPDADSIDRWSRRCGCSCRSWASRPPDGLPEPVAEPSVPFATDVQEDPPWRSQDLIARKPAARTMPTESFGRARAAGTRTSRA